MTSISVFHDGQITKWFNDVRMMILLILGFTLVQSSLYTHAHAKELSVPMTPQFQRSSHFQSSVYPRSDPRSQNQNLMLEEDPLPLYLSYRATLVIPQNATSDALAMGLGFGLADETGNFFGLRAIWVPNPPRDFLSSRFNQIKSAWGPVLEWHNLFSVNGRLSFYSNVAGGFIYGTPQESQTDESANMTELEKNRLLPIIELGFGLRLTSRRVGEYRVFIAPELGYIFTGQSPYASINIGVY